MPITNDRDDDPQAQGTTPPAAAKDGAAATEESGEQGALGWAKLGLSALCCTGGVVLALTGHGEIGMALIGASGIQITVAARKK